MTDDETILPAFAPQPPMFEGETAKPETTPERPKRGRRKKAEENPTIGAINTLNARNDLNPPPKKSGRPKGSKNKSADTPAGTSDLALALKAAAGLKEAEMDLFVKVVELFDTVAKASRAKVAASLARMYG